MGQVRDSFVEIPLEEKERLMAEIADLKRDKLEVWEYKEEEEMKVKVFDPCLSKDERWCVTNISEQMGVLMEEKKGHAAAFDD